MINIVVFNCWWGVGIERAVVPALGSTPAARWFTESYLLCPASWVWWRAPWRFRHKPDQLSGVDHLAQLLIVSDCKPNVFEHSPGLLDPWQRDQPIRKETDQYQITCSKQLRKVFFLPLLVATIVKDACNIEVEGSYRQLCRVKVSVCINPSHGRFSITCIKDQERSR